MCDYSLLTFPNRLARENEELMVYRFPSGSIGLVSPAELQPKCEARQRRSVWQAVKAFFNPVEACRVTAVCVPPGARLKLHDLSPEFQRDNHVRAEEEVKFEQLTAAVNTYRDAVCFENGRKVRLQHLPEGLRVTVTNLEGAEVSGPVPHPEFARWAA